MAITAIRRLKLAWLVLTSPLPAELDPTTPIMARTQLRIAFTPKFTNLQRIVFVPRPHRFPSVFHTPFAVATMRSPITSSPAMNTRERVRRTTVHLASTNSPT